MPSIPDYTGKGWLITRLLCCVVVFMFSCIAHAEIYKWVDEHGNTHYGDKPSSADAEQVPISKPASGNPNQASRAEKQRRLLKLYEEERTEKKQQQAQQEKDKLLQQQNCAKAKKNLAAINRASFLYKKSEDPKNPYVYSDEERQKITEKAQKAVDQWCK